MLTLTSCKIQYNKKAYIEAYKLTATYSCLSEGMESKLYDSIVLKNDASFSYDVLAGPNNYKIDSVGRSQGKKIPRTPLKDLGNKKLIYKHCLQYYKSKELNKLAKKWWKENKL